MTTLPCRIATLSILALAACSSDPAGPETRDPAALTIVELATTHPPFFNTEVSFWARPGRDSEAIIFFQDEDGDRGESFARLRVRSESLEAFPDGRSFGATDSVLITLRVPDPTRALVELLPGGLRFRAARPAELRLEYDHGDPDLNDDGTVDSLDAALQEQFAIWRQETTSGPFVKLASIRVKELAEVRADILGFSRFAIAY